MDYDFYIDTPIHKSALLDAHIGKKEESLPVDFLRSAAYAGVQEPVNGVVQLIDKTAGTNILPKIQVIDHCEKADYGSVRWHVQQFGSMAGVSANFIALGKAVGGTSEMLFGRLEDTAENKGALALRAITDSAATGFIHNGLFRPVSDSEGNFYAARLKNATVGAASFAVGTASSLGINYLGQGQDNMLGKIMRSDVGSTVLSGIPSGFAYAEIKSLADGKGPASAQAIGRSIYSFSILSGAFVAGKEMVGGTYAEDCLKELMKSPLDMKPVITSADAAAAKPVIDVTPPKPIAEVKPAPAKPDTDTAALKQATQASNLVH